LTQLASCFQLSVAFFSDHLAETFEAVDRSLLSESQLRFIVEVEPEGRRLTGRVVMFQDWESNAGPLVATREKPVR
jgi:primosomal protein N''